jgi:hypothetical protein
VHIYRRTAAVSPKATRANSVHTTLHSSVKGTAVSSTINSVSSCDAKITSTVGSSKNKDAPAADSTITASTTIAGPAGTASTASTATEDAAVAPTSVAAVDSAECVIKEASIERGIKMSTRAVIDEHKEGILDGMYCVHTHHCYAVMLFMTESKGHLSLCRQVHTACAVSLLTLWCVKLIVAA